MNKNLIPYSFHFFFKENEIFDIYKFFSVKSVIEILNPNEVYFHCMKTISLNDFYLKKLNKNIEIIYYNKENDLLSESIDLFILKILKSYGGIYMDFSNLILNNDLFLKLRNYNFFKSVDDKIIGSEPNSFMINKYLEFKEQKTIVFKQKFGIRNIKGLFINNYILTDSDIFYENDVYKFLFNEIFDYSFSHYFYLIKKISLININDNNHLKNLNLENIFNKTTLYNLLIKYILGYKYFFNNNIKENIILINNKYNLINNIDYIYWINLEISHDRAKNMETILKNFDKNIISQRISAVDGNNIKNISNSYFHLNENSESNIYPNYTNKEYAILLSHLNTIEQFINIDESNLIYKVALVFEDDLSLDFMKYWNIDIKTLIENAPLDWELIMLGYFSLNMKKPGLYNKWDNEFSAIAYLVNYNIKDKIGSMKNDGKWICKNDDLMVSDNYIFSKFTTYVYKYPFFTFPNENDSTLHEDHIDYHKIYKNINYLTLENIYEEFI